MHSMCSLDLSYAVGSAEATAGSLLCSILSPCGPSGVKALGLRGTLKNQHAKTPGRNGSVIYLK